MKPVIENLQSELYQLENKQAKGANFVATLEAGGRKMPQNFLWSTWKTEYEKSTIFELYADDNKSKYSNNPKDIPKSAKKIMKFYT